MDNLGGAKPLAESTIPFPPPFTSQNSTLTYFVFSAGEFLSVGKIAHNLQRQVSLVDSLSLQRGVHSLKFGVDYRHLSPFADSPLYMQGDFFQDNSGLASGTIQSGSLTASNNTAFILRNLGVFGQDTWRVRSRLTLTYGLRWDVDFVPTVSKGPNFAAVTSFNNLSKFMFIG